MRLIHLVRLVLLPLSGALRPLQRALLALHYRSVFNDSWRLAWYRAGRRT